MSERSGLSLAAILWVVAFAALGMAAFTTAANAAGVISLACVGHASTSLALVIDRADRESARSVAGRKTTVLYLGVLFAFELIGTLVLLAPGEQNLGLWFALGASFSAVGIAATWSRVPSDNVLACQLFFHTVILAPLLAALPLFLIDLDKDDGRPSVSLGRTAMSLVILVFRVVAIPLLIVTLATVLAYNLSRPKRDRDLPWAVMTAHQAIFAVIVFRWSAHGL
jgi:hypothetical protein